MRTRYWTHWRKSAFRQLSGKFTFSWTPSALPFVKTTPCLLHVNGLIEENLGLTTCHFNSRQWNELTISLKYNLSHWFCVKGSLRVTSLLAKCHYLETGKEWIRFGNWDLIFCFDRHGNHSKNVLTPVLSFFAAPGISNSRETTPWRDSASPTIRLYAKKQQSVKRRQDQSRRRFVFQIDQREYRRNKLKWHCPGANLLLIIPHSNQVHFRFLLGTNEPVHQTKSTKTTRAEDIARCNPEPDWDAWSCEYTTVAYVYRTEGLESTHYVQVHSPQRSSMFIQHGVLPRKALLARYRQRKLATLFSLLDAGWSLSVRTNLPMSCLRRFFFQRDKTSFVWRVQRPQSPYIVPIWLSSHTDKLQPASRGAKYQSNKSIQARENEK